MNVRILMLQARHFVRGSVRRAVVHEEDRFRAGGSPDA
jgi:hypothetical protein